MKKIVAFLQLIRASNLLIMLGTQVMAWYCLHDYLLPEDLLERRFLFLVAATLLTAAGGYIINDYYDVKPDLVNKPDKVIVGTIISRRWAMLLHISFNIIALLLGASINRQVALSILVCSLLLFSYSFYFKMRFLTGNLIVAGLSAFVILIMALLSETMPFLLTAAYATFAFLTTMLREIIKDTEDVKGDSLSGCRTLPIVLGVVKTRQVLLYINILLMLLLVLFMLGIFQHHFDHPYVRYVYALYLFLFVLIPLAGMLPLLAKADVKKEFSRLSTLTKLVMVAGILSMMCLRL